MIRTTQHAPRVGFPEINSSHSIRDSPEKSGAIQTRKVICFVQKANQYLGWGAVTKLPYIVLLHHIYIYIYIYMRGRRMLCTNIEAPPPLQKTRRKTQYRYGLQRRSETCTLELAIHAPPPPFPRPGVINTLTVQDDSIVMASRIRCKTTWPSTHPCSKREKAFVLFYRTFC